MTLLLIIINDSNLLYGGTEVLQVELQYYFDKNFNGTSIEYSFMPIIWQRNYDTNAPITHEIMGQNMSNLVNLCIAYLDSLI
jgi:hypothetical protein